MAKRWGVGVNLDRCIGCYACITACKQENNVSLGVFFNRVFKIGPRGKIPKVEFHYIYRMCMHCERPPCLEGCPEGAISKREDGIVLLERDKCSGCEECIKACPYGVFSFNSELKVVEKCNFCHHRIDVGKEPACINACVAEVFTFGDLSDSKSIVSEYLTKGDAILPLSQLSTGPSICYRARSDFSREELSVQPFLQRWT